MPPFKYQYANRLKEKVGKSKHEKSEVEQIATLQNFLGVYSTPHSHHKSN